MRRNIQPILTARSLRYFGVREDTLDYCFLAVGEVSGAH
jgi:hypothetical protein